VLVSDQVVQPPFPTPSQSGDDGRVTTLPSAVWSFTTTAWAPEMPLGLDTPSRATHLTSSRNRSTNTVYRWVPSMSKDRCH
jgi:hypothetical protein